MPQRTDGDHGDDQPERTNSQRTNGRDRARLAVIANARLNAMALAQDEVAGGGVNSAALGDLLVRTLSPFDLDRFIFEPREALSSVDGPIAGGR